MSKLHLYKRAEFSTKSDRVDDMIQALLAMRRNDTIPSDAKIDSIRGNFQEPRGLTITIEWTEGPGKEIA